MLDADSLLLQRFGHQRPGLELTAIEDAALPVTVVGVDVLAQERKGVHSRGQLNWAFEAG